MAARTPDQVPHESMSPLRQRCHLFFPTDITARVALPGRLRSRLDVSMAD